VKRAPATGVVFALALLAGMAAAAPPEGPPHGPRRLGPRPPAQPRRVVTLAPSLTAIVLALGEGERLVGVSRFDERPEVAKLPRVGGFIDPSVEAVLALRPDLVLVQPAPGNKRPVERLAELRTPVLALPLHTVADTLAALREVGRALGVPARGEGLAAEVEAARARVRAKREGRAPLRVLFVYEWEPLVVAGPGSFAAELLADAGVVNVAAGAATPYPVLGVEAVIAARPDVVVDASHDPSRAARLRTLPGLSEARYLRLPSRDLVQPGPHLGRGLEELVGLLYPDAP
jgi:iron complex transport system substrate-binding protein